MTREIIEGMREAVLPFVKKKLLEINYENLGKSDAEEFEKHFNEILDLAIKALEQEPKTGHWITKIKSDLRGDKWPTNPKCSECGREPYYSNTIFNYKFCPYCGADMREVEK